jgi:hypothetical protein
MKASLLSGLVFPGIGHLVLKQYLRGSALIVVALIASSEILAVATRQALAIVDRINSGDIPVDSGALTDMLSSSSSGADSTLVSISWIALGACWLFGIVDSYRLGRTQDIESADEG